MVSRGEGTQKAIEAGFAGGPRIARVSGTGHGAHLGGCTRGNDAGDLDLNGSERGHGFWFAVREREAATSCDGLDYAKRLAVK